MGIAAQGEPRLLLRLAKDRAGLAGKRDERAGLEALQPRDRADIEIRAMLGEEIDHLAADHALPARRLGQRRHQLATHRRIAMGVGLNQDLERHRQQPVARQHRGRVVECLVAGRAAAAQIAVVHRRQIVVDERIGMDQFDRAGDLQGAASRHREKLRARQDEERPQPLAGRQHRVAHRLEHPRLEAGRHGNQLSDRGIGERRGLRQRGGEFHSRWPELISQG